MMRFRFPVVVAMCAAVCLMGALGAGSAMAEDAPTFPKQQQSDSVPGKVKPTPEQLEEMEQVYGKCSTSIQSKLQDCRCIAVAFLDVRLVEPQKAQERILFEMKDICPNLPEIAGGAYKACMQWAPRKRDDFEDFCGCVGKTTARMMKDDFRTDRYHVRKIKTKALNACGFADTIKEKARQVETEKNRLRDEAKEKAAQPAEPPVNDTP